MINPLFLLICLSVKIFSRISCRWSAYVTSFLVFLRKPIEDPLCLFLKYRLGGTSADSIPVLTEAHGLSLLSAHLSTFDVFASLFFPTGNHLRTGGSNHGLVPV